MPKLPALYEIPLNNGLVILAWERLRPPGLSPALAQIGELILEGATNEEIAKVRGTSINTVNKQVRALFTHFNVQCREELIGAWCQYAANPCA